MPLPFDFVGQLSDEDLLARLERAAVRERHATAELIALLIELDARRLFLAQGYSSLFTYCTQALHLSEHAAYNRIETARAARRCPVILERLADGGVTLAAVRILAPHLTSTNHIELLESAHHRSKREVEQLVARLTAKPDAPASIRKLPVAPILRGAAPDDPDQDDISSQTAPLLTLRKAPAEVKPVAPERYKIQFTVGRETYEQLRRVQDLMRHTIPSGDPAAIFERALKLLFNDLLKRKVAATDRPRVPREPVSLSRHIPAAVKREVWRRDDGRCAFRGAEGRCTETGFLEFHHLIPFAEGGASTTGNIELRCRAHNQHEAEQWFGPQQPPLLRETPAAYGEVTVRTKFTLTTPLAYRGEEV